MKRLVVGTAKQTLWALLYGVVGGAVVAIAVLVIMLENRPDLEVWHKVDLDEEFDRKAEIDSFEAYLALEDRLFAQLDREVYDVVAQRPGVGINRYQRGSLADPGRWPRNWNRSFELSREDPGFSVVLVHGMSDSPYSVRGLAESLHEAGAYTLGLRVPGHGTAPSGLLDVEWRDMAAAVRLAVVHARAQAPGRPLILVGYSNGGALVVNYALEALADEALPAVDQLILLSPQIGITRLAALAAWQERLGRLLGLQKLAWNAILPEYDPFKYGSFALNAGRQAHLITAAIQEQISDLTATGRMRDFPPVLAFQSVADATIEAPVLVTGLFDRLPEGSNELVLFDVNRSEIIGPIMTRDPGAWLDAMLADSNRRFTVEVISNVSPDTQSVAIDRREPESDEIRRETFDGMSWPKGVYSLSHIALPFSPQDPLYGGPDAGESPGIKLGNLALRGERGVLQVTGNDMLRLRWNPFYDYVRRRIVETASVAKTSRQ